MQPVDAAGLVEFKWIPDALRPQRLSRMDEMGGGGMVDLTPRGGEVGESRASSMSQGAPHPKMTQGEAQTNSGQGLWLGVRKGTSLWFQVVEFESLTLNRRAKQRTDKPAPCPP